MLCFDIEASNLFGIVLDIDTRTLPGVVVMAVSFWVIAMSSHAAMLSNLTM